MTKLHTTKLDEIARYYDTHDTSAELQHAELETDTEWDPMVSTTLRLPKSLLDWVREQADAEQLDPTELIRWWIEQQRDADRNPSGRSRQSLEERLRLLEDIVLGQQRRTMPSMPQQELERRRDEAVTQPLHVPHVRAAARVRKPPKMVTARRIR